MFFKVATGFVAVLFFGLIVAGVRQRSAIFVAMNFLGMALNAAVVVLDIWGRLNLTMLLAATPALAFILGVDVTMILRELRDDQPPAAALDDKPAGAEPEARSTYLFVVNEKRPARELDRLTNCSAKRRALALEFWRQGNEALRQRRAQEAESHYEKSLAQAPTPSGLCNLAAALLAANRAEAALQRCKEAGALDPEHLETWLNRGLALLLLHREKEAMACFDHAVALQPNALEPWLWRGNALIQAGQFAPAVECYDSALDLNPNRPDCWKKRPKVLSGP
jgi:tetratricopeptide (TPR) repeat protein